MVLETTLTSLNTPIDRVWTISVYELEDPAVYFKALAGEIMDVGNQLKKSVFLE